VLRSDLSNYTFAEVLHVTLLIFTGQGCNPLWVYSKYIHTSVLVWKVYISATIMYNDVLFSRSQYYI
jgi:hypothetical protein